MAGFARSQRIGGRPEDVFTFLTSPENIPSYMPDVVRVEGTSPGPPRVGASYRETRRLGKRTASATITVSACDPPRHYAVTADDGCFRATYDFRLRPEEGRTVVDLAAEVGAAWVFLRPLVPMMLRMMRRADADLLDRLKRAFEARALAPSVPRREREMSFVL
ncbi:MAG TPA: SRPBCC family protein [Phycisphaerales bacterium]|nr:SRPBCC family protein [Phycisphaerales bacterium]